MKTLALRCSRGMLVLGMVAIIALGLLLGALNLALPFADRLRGQAEDSLGRALGVDVHIGRIVARWYGDGPRVLFRDVTLSDPVDADQHIRVGELRLDLALLESLRQGRLRLEQVVLRDTEFTLFHHRDGRTTISGLSRPGSASPRALTLFESLPNMLLEDARIHWRREAADYRDLLLHITRAQLRNVADRHQIDASIDLPARHSDASLRLVFLFDGRLDRPASLAGRLYLEARRFPLEVIARARLPSGARLEGGLSGRLWVDLAHGQPARIDARARLVAALAQASAQDPPTPLNGDYALRWLRGEDGGWRFDLQALNRNNLVLPQRVAADRQPGDGLRLFVDRIGLGLLAPWTRQRLAGPIARWLGQARPTGELHEVRVRFANDEDWRVHGGLRDLRLAAVDKVPGIAGLAATFDAAPQRIELSLHGEGTVLDTNGLFRASLGFDVDGKLSIARDEDGLRIDSDELRIVNPDLHTRTALHVELPKQGPPLLDIVSRFHDGDARHASRYFPVRILKPRLLGWLDQAFPRGRVPSGGFLFYGRPDHFPFEKTLDGRFQILFDFEKASIHYHKDWPAIEDAAARVEFLNNGLTVSGGRGRIRRLALSDVGLRIHPLRHAQRVDVHGKASGELGEALALLRPRLHRRGYLDRLEPSGPASAELRLAIPIGPKARARHLPPSVDARLRLRDNRLRVAGGATVFDAIEGLLHIDQDGIDARGLSARWRGNPLRIDVERERPAGTRVVAQGRIRADSLGVAMARFLGGAAVARAEMQLPPAGVGRPELRIDSDLRGVAIDMPPPFAKPARRALKLRLGVEFEDDGNQRLSLRLADLARVQALLEAGAEGPRPRWLQLHLGGGEPPPPIETPGARIDGRLAELDVALWWRWLKRVIPKSDEPPPMDHLEARVRIARLLSPLGAWRDTRLFARFDGGAPAAWAVQLRGKGIDGRIARAGRRPVTIAFETLRVDRPASATAPTEPSPNSPDPTGLPPFDLGVERLVVDDQLLGRLALRGRRTRGGLRFEGLELDDGDNRISGDGRWTRRGNGQRSTWNLALHLARLGRFLAGVGISDKVRDGAADVRLALNWSGGPADFALARLRGDAGIELRKARFIGVKPGIAKLLGLVSLDALGRRLRGKFDDILKEGVYVDEASGTLTIAAGRLETRGFKVRGPMGRVTLDGWLDLKPPQALDVLATVVPEFGSTLTVAGAVAGGPVVGAALVVARKLLRKQLDEASTLLFRIDGTLDRPTTRNLKRERSPHGDISDIQNYEEDAGGR